MIAARLYISPRCFLCRFVEPGIRGWFRRQGIALMVFKLDGETARQVNGTAVETIDAKSIPALPALRIGRVVVVGMGIVAVLRAATAQPLIWRKPPDIAGRRGS